MKKCQLFNLLFFLITVPFMQESLAQTTLEGHTKWVNSVAFSHDGTLLDSGSDDGTVKLWDVATRTIVADLEEHSDVVFSVAFSPNRTGTQLASGTANGTLTLWDMSPYITSQPPTPPQSPTPDFDGDRIVGFPDFLLFVAQFGLNQGDAGYDARYDLDGDGSNVEDLLTSTDGLVDPSGLAVRDLSR